MDFVEFKAVLAVANHRSFRRAAAELGMSPSALSHAVSQLERRLGVRLFNRTTRSVAVSEAGEQFLAQVRPALAALNDAMTGLSAFRETPAGTIRINASEGAARIILAPVVMAFLRRFPDMRVDIVTNGKFTDIVAEGFDAGIRSAGDVPLDMIAVPCSPPVRFVVVGAPAYFAHHAVPLRPEELDEHECIRTRMPGGSLYPWEFQRGAQKVVITPQGTLTLDNENLMVAAAVEGAGLAWTSVWSVQEHIADGKLVTALEDWSADEAGLVLYYPSHRHIPAGMQALVDLLKKMTFGT